MSEKPGVGCRVSVMGLRRELGLGGGSSDCTGVFRHPIPDTRCLARANASLAINNAPPGHQWHGLNRLSRVNPSASPSIGFCQQGERRGESSGSLYVGSAQPRLRGLPLSARAIDGRAVARITVADRFRCVRPGVWRGLLDSGGSDEYTSFRYDGLSLIHI